MKQPAEGALARARRGIGAAALRALLSSLLMLQGRWRRALRLSTARFSVQCKSLARGLAMAWQCCHGTVSDSVTVSELYGLS